MVDGLLSINNLPIEYDIEKKISPRSYLPSAVLLTTFSTAYATMTLSTPSLSYRSANILILHYFIATLNFEPSKF